MTNLAPIPCAAHVPPRCKGETKSRSKWRSVVTAFLKALCDEMRGVAKSTSKVPRKASQNSIGDAPSPTKIEAWDVSGSPNATLKLHTAAQKQPRAPKKCSRAAQEGPKSGQERPRAQKGQPSDAQESAKRFQNPSQDAFLAQSSQEALLDRLKERFCVVLWLQLTRRDMEKP